jgi:hypothetical protein
LSKRRSSDLSRVVGSGEVVGPQILAVLEGSGEVSGANGVDEPIGAGEAVFLHEGEDHGMKSKAGLTVLILQGANLDRFRARPTTP